MIALAPYIFAALLVFTLLGTASSIESIAKAIDRQNTVLWAIRDAIREQKQ